LCLRYSFGMALMVVYRGVDPGLDPLNYVGGMVSAQLSEGSLVLSEFPVVRVSK